MNNSSAYNNVLLKSSVQTQAAQAPVEKRNYQDDQTAASFQQNFQDAHDSLRERDEKITKPVATKKAEPVDNRKPANDVEKKSSAPAKQTDENNSDDQVSDKEKNATGDNTLAKQNSAGENTEAKKAESKSIDKKVCVEDESSADALIPSMPLTNTNTPTQLPVVAPTDVPAQVNADATLTPDLTNVEATLAPVSGNAETDSKAQVTSGISSNVPADPLTVVDSNASTIQPLKGDAAILAGNQTKTDKPLETDGKTVADSVDASSVVAAQQLVADTISSQAVIPAVTPDATAGQAPAVLAALGSAALPKAASTQATSIPVTDSSSDADGVSALASSITSEKSPVKTDTAGDLALAAKTDATPAQTLDSKSTFEKAFQSMILPESGKREESSALPITAPTGSSTTSSTNTLDSMLRFNDAQAPAARSFVVQTAVPVPVGQPQWSQAVGEKVLWLAAQNVSSAEIHLNPENLGPVQVKVSVNQEQTTINFTSHHAVVREALDQNLGRLRDMFSEQGLNLVNVDVSDKSFSRQQGDAKDQKGQANTNDIALEEEAPVAMSVITQQRLVDHYA